MKFYSLFRNVHGQEMCLLPQTTLGIRNSRDKGKCSGTVSDPGNVQVLYQIRREFMVSFVLFLPLTGKSFNLSLFLGCAAICDRILQLLSRSPREIHSYLYAEKFSKCY